MDHGQGQLQNFCFMPIFGLNNGMVPILSYNFAQKKWKRVKDTANLAFCFSVGLMIVVGIFLELYPNFFLQMFNASDKMLAIGIPALRICVVSLPFAAISLIRTTSMQALTYARYTLIVNILRQFVIIIPAFHILSLVFGQVGYLWFALPITEITCAIISTFFYHRMSKEIYAI